MKRAPFVVAFGCVVALTSPLRAQAPAAATQTRADSGRTERLLAVLDRVPQSPTFARIQSRTYDFKEAGKPMNYELFVPSSYDRSRPTPLVVALHCLSSDAQHMIRYQGLTEEAEKRGFLVVAPMGYNTRGWYGSRGPSARTTAPSSSRRTTDASEDPPNLGELSELDVLNVIKIVRNEFNVDARRMYLMGHSMGGGGTFYLGMKYPEMWAALGAFAPAIYSSPDQLATIKDMPVIVVQGELDELVDVKNTRQWVAKMRELGMRHEYIEIPGGDHMEIAALAPTSMRRVFDLFAQSVRK